MQIPIPSAIRIASNAFRVWLAIALLLASGTAGTAYAAPDLVPTLLSGPSAADAGEIFNVSWDAQNSGDATANPSWTDTIFLSSDATYDGADINLGTKSHGSSLAASASYSDSLSVQPPYATTPGMYYLLIFADAASQLPESNESNNVLAVPIQMTKPDLVPTLVSGPAAAAAGEIFNVSWDAQNSGDGTANPAWIDGVYLSTNATYDGGDIGLCGKSHGSTIGASGTYSDSCSVQPPYATTPGTYYLLIFLDATGQVGESNETNNVMATSIQISKPDLVATSITAPATANAGEIFNVSWNVSNAGPIPATQPWTDTIFLSSDATYDVGDINLGTKSRGSSLAASASYGDSRTVQPPYATAPGTYYLLIFADAADQVAETDNANNVLAASILIVKPDLHPTSFTAPSAGNVNASVNVAWMVTNAGDGAAGPPWTDRVYFSTNATYEPGDTALGDNVRASSLAGASSYSDNRSVTVPNVAIGSYYLLLFTDVGSEVAESSDANNVTAISFEVTVCGDGLTGGLEQCDEAAANGTGTSCCTAGCLFRPNAEVCRPSVGDCDMAETCTGAGAACPADAFVADTTPCDDASACTIEDQCMAGVCEGDSMICGDGVVEGTCNEDCDDGGVLPNDGCDASCRFEPCKAAPELTCKPPFVAGKSSVKLRNDSDNIKDSLKWKWSSGSATTLAELEDPLASDDYWMCIYDGGALVSSTKVPFGGICDGKPCWSGNTKGYKFKSKTPNANGATALRLGAGSDGHAKAQFQGKGASLELPDVSTVSGPLVVQLVKPSDGTCWTSTFSAPFAKNDGVNLSDKAD